MLEGNRIWFALGVGSGLAFGGFGSYFAHRAWPAAGVLGSCLMLGEAVAQALLGLLAPATAVGRDSATLAVQAFEAFTGAILLIVAVRAWLLQTAPRRA